MPSGQPPRALVATLPLRSEAGGSSLSEDHTVGELDIGVHLNVRHGLDVGVLTLVGVPKVIPMKVGGNRQDVAVFVLDIELMEHREHCYFAGAYVYG